jgi:hypothetical protein
MSRYDIRPEHPVLLRAAAECGTGGAEEPVASEVSCRFGRLACCVESDAAESGVVRPVPVAVEAVSTDLCC